MKTRSFKTHSNKGYEYIRKGLIYNTEPDYTDRWKRREGVISLIRHLCLAHELV